MQLSHLPSPAPNTRFPSQKRPGRFVAAGALNPVSGEGLGLFFAFCLFHHLTLIIFPNLAIGLIHHLKLSVLDVVVRVRFGIGGGRFTVFGGGLFLLC